METSPEPTPAKRKCTTADVNKMSLVETIREFDLPQQFPSMLNELRKRADEIENSCDKIVSTSAVPLTPQFVSKVQKLRILSRDGRDLGEFNVQLRDDESRGKTIMLTKSPTKNDPVTVIRTSYNSGKLYPRILRQSKNLTNRLNVKSPNVTLLSQNISRIDQINTMRHQQSTTLPKSNERSTNDVENRKVIASNSNNKIDIKTGPTIETIYKSGKSCPRILKQNKNLNRLDLVDLPNITFLGRTIPGRDVIMIEQQQSTNLLNSNKFRSSNKRKEREKLAEKRKVQTNNGDVEIDVETISTNKNSTNKTIFINTKNSTCSNKNDIKSLSAANCKNLVVRLTNCMKTSENKGKCITSNANAKAEKDQVESLKNKEYNQDRKSTKSSSFNNKSFLDKLRITDEKNMLQSKSFSNKQENIMTIIPNNETVSLNQSAHFLSNTYASSTSNKNMNPNVEHVQESQRVVSTTDTNMKSNVQNKDLSSKLDIIKKAMDSVKDSELRELALKALADCGIGIERYVPVPPPEQHKAVHDSQVQTIVFGLLDPKSFILINKDIESLYRINQITLHDEPIAEPTSEQEDNFDIDSFINEFIRGIENDSDILKINETLSMSRLRCRNILNHLERDFQSAKQYDRNGRLNIHNAVLSNDVRLVQRHLLVLRHCKESVDIPTETGMTSLELAVKYDICKEIVKILLDVGAQPVVPIYLHESALIIASKQSSLLLPMLVKQVSNRALLDHTDSEGYAALHYCSIYGNLQGVQMLLLAGATIDLQDKKSGRTPLFHALDNSHKSVAEMLLKAGAMAHIANYAGQTPIISIPTTLTETESS